MARLPQPGGDSGSWGQILNDYLAQVHEADGTLKADTVNAKQLAPGSVDANAIGAGSASNGQVLARDSSTPSGLSWQSVGSGGTVPDASTTQRGVIQLTGDLAGTATNPTVPGLASKEPVIMAGTSSQFYRGDKTWQTIDKATVGLANIDNTSDANKPISTAVQQALNAKADDGDLSTVAKTGSYNDLLNRPVVPAQFNPVAGANITITGTYPNMTFSATSTNVNVPGAVEDNVVTFDNTGGLKDSGIASEDIVESTSINTIVTVTQAAYDALPTPRPTDVLYIVVG